MNISTDKLLHLLAGSAIAGAMHPFGLLIAVLVLSAAAIAKEVWDYFFGGTVDVCDAMATAWGGAMMLGWIEVAGSHMQFFAVTPKPI